MRLTYKYTILFLFLSLNISTSLRAQSRACQDFTLYIDTLNCIPVPVAETDGYLYFNLCPDQEVHIAVYGVYPDNGTFYTQHDTLNTYTWILGDGATETTIKEPFINHEYNSIKGYDISISAQDTEGCESDPITNVRARIAGSPITSINTSGTFCQYDTVNVDISSIVQVSEYTYELDASQSFDSTMFLPDGPNCPPGYYFTDVVFDVFTPGASITSEEDILSVCVNMEHTYIGDLSMELICPSGKTVQLKTQAGGGRYFGSPGCMPTPHTCDNGAKKCNAASNPAGEGWNYCWSEYYPNRGDINNGPVVGNNQIDSTDSEGLEGFYQPANSFQGLIGCPLNGLWTIKITDHLGIDNGYIFDWTLNLDPALLPQSWSYTVPYDSAGISGPGVISQQNGIMVFSPPTSGTQNYTVTAYDEYGCSFDSIIELEIQPMPELIMPDTVAFCAGGYIDIDGGSCTNCSYIWNTGETNHEISVANGGIYWRKVFSQAGCSATDTCIVLERPIPPPIQIKHN